MRKEKISQIIFKARHLAGICCIHNLIFVVKYKKKLLNGSLNDDML